MVGKNVATWLDDFSGSDSQRKIKVAGYLLNTSEYYFDNNKVLPEDRLKIFKTIELNAGSEEPEVRKCVAYLLGLLKVWSVEIEAALRKLLSDNNSDVQATGVWAVGSIGSPASPLVSTVLELASHANREVRWRVPWSILQIKPTDSEVREELFKLARDSDNTTRMYAYDALAVCLVALDNEVVSVVKKGLKDEAGEVRGAACRVIAAIEGDWSKLKSNLDSIFKKDIHGNKVEAVLALYKHWPESADKKHIKSWLIKNDGYWWSEKLLAGESV